MNIFYTVALLIIFVLFAVLLGFLKKKKVSFTLLVFIALALGIVYGTAIQAIFGSSSDVTVYVNSWFGILGTGFTKALQFLIVPIVLVSIISATTKIGKGPKAAKTGGRILGVLLVTTAISALVGFFTVKIFKLDASGLIANITSKTDKTPTDIPTALLNFVPSNLFSALTANSAIPIVFIALLIGFAILAIDKENHELGKKFVNGVDGATELVMTITDFVIDFTPYGVLALISKVTSTSNFNNVMTLVVFVLASYAAILVVFLIHFLILSSFKVNLVKYIGKVLPALLFAFTSRSSAATLPLTIKTQTEKLGVGKGHANFAGAFGLTIGQNGCAGVYPAIVTTLVASALGWNTWSIGFVVTLILYITIGSIGIGGVGGGATNATILVLSLFGLPIELVAILISVDFIIDMARTALNVNDAILAGIISSKLDKEFSDDIFNDKITFEELEAQRTDSVPAAV